MHYVLSTCVVARKLSGIGLQPVQGELRSPGPAAGGRGCVSTCRRMEVWHASRESAISRLTCSRARFTGGCGRTSGGLREPMRNTPPPPRLLAALGGTEMAQEAMRTVDPVVKSLVGIKAA